MKYIARRSAFKTFFLLASLLCLDKALMCRGAIIVTDSYSESKSEFTWQFHWEQQITSQEIDYFPPGRNLWLPSAYFIVLGGDNKANDVLILSRHSVGPHTSDVDPSNWFEKWIDDIDSVDTGGNWNVIVDRFSVLHPQTMPGDPDHLDQYKLMYRGYGDSGYFSLSGRHVVPEPNSILAGAAAALFGLRLLFTRKQ